MALKLKLDDDGKVVVKDGKPVYLYEDGKEFVADIDSMLSKINTQSKDIEAVRKRAQDVESRFEPFKDLDADELDVYLDALEEIGGLPGLDKLKSSKNVDIDAIKKQITEVYDGKLKEKDTVVQTKDAQIRQLLVSNGFGTSKFVSENLLIPPDIVEATFGKHFKVEDNQVVAYLGENKILSRENPGEIASIDEALNVIVDAYPMKDRILKAAGGGSGAPGGGNSGQGSGANSIPRSQFNDMDPGAQAEYAMSGGLVTD